jgi:hypothetical protein
MFKSSLEMQKYVFIRELVDITDEKHKGIWSILKKNPYK